MDGAGTLVDFRGPLGSEARLLLQRLFPNLATETAVAPATAKRETLPPATSPAATFTPQAESRYIKDHWARQAALPPAAKHPKAQP